MSILLEEFDPTPGVIEPTGIIEPIENFPEVFVTTFSAPLIAHLVEEQQAEVIASYGNASLEVQVYRVRYGGKEVAVGLSPVGAPACVGGLEEVIAMGAKKIVMFGSCGVLSREIADGKVIVPTAALRDEGTSYHYAPPSEEIALNPHGVQTIVDTLKRLGIEYVTGKTWTTDAFYRETAGKVAHRKEQGAIAVDMECSACAAVAEFRGVTFAQFLYAADNLDASQWEKRGLSEVGMHIKDTVFQLALECAVAL